MNNLDTIQTLIKRGALFVCNHSGGKDSQVMYIKMKEIIPHDQMIVIHAHLEGVEWEGTEQHIRDTIDHELIVCRAVKTFFEMVERRGMWPSPQYRQCTSDLKRNPIEKALRHYLKAHPEFDGLLVNCMGLRAEESSARAKKTTFKLNNKNSKAGREWYDWLPIHEMLETEVFQTIEDAGEEPHWAYGAGMTRLSCCFCIMGSKADTCRAAKLNPELFQKYVDMEKKIDHTFMMPTKKNGKRFLDEIVKEGEVFITSASNNCFPISYNRFQCTYLETMLKEQNREAVDTYILEQYSGGMMQGGSNEYHQTLQFYGSATLENLQRLRALKKEKRGAKHVIKRGANYLYRVRKSGALLTSDVERAQKFSIIEATIKAKGYNGVEIEAI